MRTFAACTCSNAKTPEKQALGAIEDELHAFVRGDEPEPFVETVRAGAGFIRGQLDQRATALARFVDRPGQHGMAEPSAAEILVHPDRLDLGPEGTPAGQAGKERQLHGGDDAIPRLRHDQDVRRVAVDRGEGPPVGLQAGVVPDAIAGGPELVGREQAHDRGQVTGLGPAQDDRGLTYVQRGQRIHPTSVPETSDCPGLRACGARIRRGG
jgi:hypothetical protein